MFPGSAINTIVILAWFNLTRKNTLAYCVRDRLNWFCVHDCKSDLWEERNFVAKSFMGARTFGQTVFLSNNIFSSVSFVY